MKKLIPYITALSLLVGCGSTSTSTTTSTSTAAATTQESAEPLNIVVTNFPAYDLACAVAGDLANVQLLLPPGTESHSFEPSPADMISIDSSDWFFYVGGESEAWVDTLLSAVSEDVQRTAMLECNIPLLEEEIVEGMEEEEGHDHDHGDEEEDHDHEEDEEDHDHEEDEDHDHDEDEDHDHDEEEDHDHDEEEESTLGSVIGADEHVWTSPKNMVILTQDFADVFKALDADNSDVYQANAESYMAELTTLDADFETFFQSLDDKTMVFGDRFPLQYFAKAYDIPYYAAFPGCSTQTEPSAATIAFLTDKVADENISTVFYIEFSNHLVADSIAEATGAQTAMFHSCHNVTQEELDNNTTYVDLMRQNLATLEATMGA